MNWRDRRGHWAVYCLVTATGFAAGCQTLPENVVRHSAELRGGKLVVCRLECSSTDGHDIRTHLAAHDHLILIYWPDDTRTPRFFVYDRIGKHVHETRSFETFLELLDRLPRGVPVGWVNTCCVPISYGMGTEREARLRSALARGGHRLLTAAESPELTAGCDDLLVCTCESRRLYLPGDSAAQGRAH